MAKWATEPNEQDRERISEISWLQTGFDEPKEPRQEKPRSLNTSGIHPAEFNVLIRLDPVEEKTAGGLHLPGNAVEREKFGSTKGTLIESAPLAFNADVWPSDMAPPSPGQRVLIAKHSGVTVKGDDGEEYRIVKDKDVVALLG